MEIVYKKGFLKDLMQLPLKTQTAVRIVLDKLSNADNLETSGVDFAPMHGKRSGRNYYRIRVGQYRLGVEYLDPDLLVIMIASRGDVYKTFPPK